MTPSAQTPMNDKLLAELREMARQGKRAKDLVAHIERSLALPPHSMVHVLGYLCRAFSIPLPVMLPLREDEGQGPFGRAIEVPVWFAALLRDEHGVETWDWDLFWRAFGGNFDAERMQTEKMHHGWIQYAEPAGQPGDRYVRGAFEIYVDKVEAFGPDAKVVFHELKDFAAAFRKHVIGEGTEPIRQRFAYQVEEQGPKYRVVCTAQAWRCARTAQTVPA